MHMKWNNSIVSLYDIHIHIHNISIIKCIDFRIVIYYICFITHNKLILKCFYVTAIKICMSWQKSNKENSNDVIMNDIFLYIPCTWKIMLLLIWFVIRWFWNFLVSLLFQSNDVTKKGKCTCFKDRYKSLIRYIYLFYISFYYW